MIIVDFKEFEKPASSNEKEPKISVKGGIENVIAEKWALTIKCLEEIEDTFQSKSEAKRLLSEARWAFSVNNFEEALKLCIKALSLPELASSDKAELLFYKGLAQYFIGKPDDAIKDWTDVIDLPEAPIEHVARALVNRGVTWGKKGETEKSLADYTRVIELPDAPVEQVAKALVNRGVTWGNKGETDKGLSDYTRVIELPEAPVERVAKALANRGWSHYEQNNFSDFLTDTEAVLTKNPSMDYAAFNLGLALLACGRDNDALNAYQKACEKYPESIEKLGMEDLIEAQKTWLSQERAEPVIKLLKSFNQEPALELEA